MNIMPIKCEIISLQRKITKSKKEEINHGVKFKDSYGQYSFSLAESTDSFRRYTLDISNC